MTHQCIDISDHDRNASPLIRQALIIKAALSFTKFDRGDSVNFFER